MTNETTRTQFFKEFLIEKSLTYKYHSGVTADFLIEHLSGELPLKNLCAKVSPELVDDVEGVAGILNVSKRRFIEMALINAIGQFHEVANEYSIYENDQPSDADLDSYEPEVI